MGPGVAFAIAAFTTGALFLLGWLYATTGNLRSWSILKKSLLWFALPILFAPAHLFQFPLGMWAWVACEEALKALAASREERLTDKFWLVALFGIWELAIDKPFWALAVAESGEVTDRLEMLGLLYSTALPVLMHLVTAAIYAFCFPRWVWAAFIASWMIHTLFNEVATYFFLSPFALIAETLVLAALLMFILGRRLQPTAADGP